MYFLFVSISLDEKRCGLLYEKTIQFRKYYFFLSGYKIQYISNIKMMYGIKKIWNNKQIVGKLCIFCHHKFIEKILPIS